MDMEMEVRRFAKNGIGADRMLRSTVLESLAVAIVEAENVECARAGRRFCGGTQIIANGIAPVAAIPTTTATLGLYNAEPAGGRSLVIDRLGFYLGSGTAAAGATLLAAVSTGQLATAVAANATGYGSQSMSGSGSQTRARWGTALTFPTSPIANAWIQILSTQQLAAANVGQGDGQVELKGAFIVPPGYCLGFAILSGAGTTPLYAITAQWTELELDLE